MKKKGFTTDDFKRYIWTLAERRCRSKDITECVAEAKNIGGVAKIVTKFESNAKTVSNKLFAAIKEEGFQDLVQYSWERGTHAGRRKSSRTLCTKPSLNI